MSVRHLSVLLFVAAAALPGRAFALQCSTLPEPTYLTATPSAEAQLKTRRRKSQRLTDEDEAEVKQSLVRNRGNVKATEAETGVHERTIRRLAEKWRVGSHSGEDSGGG